MFRQRFHAFLVGMYEFRHDCTTHFDEDLIDFYDAGRELAHRLTLRYFEQ